MKSFYIFIIVVLFSCNATAQEDTLNVKQVTLKDGSQLIGRIIAEDAEKISFKTNAGVQMEIQRDLIEEIEDIAVEEYKGELRRTDPNRTRLLFAPTARSLPKGKGYFSVYEIFFPMVAVGVTDFITISGGISLFPGLDRQLRYIAPKVRFFQVEKSTLSGGLLYIILPGSDGGTLGVLYGVYTYGTSSASFTGGLGYGLVDGEFSDKPLMVLGGDVQLGTSTKLITENWLVPGETGILLSLGIRFFGSSLAADFGLITHTEILNEADSFPFLPWIGFAYNF